MPAEIAARPTPLLGRNKRGTPATIAPKALWGETFGAAGALGMAAAVQWLNGVPPTPLVRGEPPEKVKTVLVMAMGFYGTVSAVVLRCPASHELD